MMFGYHPLWFVTMLAILAMLGVPFLLAVVAVIAALPRRPPNREPIISEDGRWLWNGQQWVPNPPPRP
jgi:hypothetical protein